MSGAERSRAFVPPALPALTGDRSQVAHTQLRDEFAGLAMQAQIAAGSDIDAHGQLIARRAWKMADAMLAERAK